jgi:hypothetical protein
VTAPTEPESGEPRRRSTVAVIIGAIVVLAALAIVAVVLLNRDNRSAGTAQPTTETTDTATPAPTDEASTAPTPTGDATSAGASRTAAPRTTAAKPPSGCSNCQMTGDNVVYHVGGTGPSTARAGTWHTDGPSRPTDLCYWEAETGSRTLGKGVEQGTDVILQAGWQFKSNGCKPWNWVSG